MTSVAFSEEGSCGEEDFDLFKAFLRDSDSDCEDAYYIQPSSASRASFDSGKSCVLQVSQKFQILISDAAEVDMSWIAVLLCVLQG